MMLALNIGTIIFGLIGIIGGILGIIEGSIMRGIFCLMLGTIAVTGTIISLYMLKVFDEE